MTRTLITIPTIAAASLILLVVSTGCGYGEPTAEGKAARTADDYLRALADGNTANACAQLTASAKGGLGRPCAEEMEAIAARIGGDELVAAAEGGVAIDVDGNHGSVEIRRLDGARLVVIRAGKRWQIASGHALEPRKEQ
jgi:hypothetical protein